MKLSWKRRISIALGVVLFLLLTWVFFERRATTRDWFLWQRLSRCIVPEIDFSGENGLEAFEMFHEKIVEVDPWFEKVNIRFDLDASSLENQSIQARWAQIPARELLREMLGNDLVDDVMSGISFSFRNGEIVIYAVGKGYEAPLSARLYDQLFTVLYEVDHSLSRLLFGDDTILGDPFSGSTNRLGLTDWMGFTGPE